LKENFVNVTIYVASDIDAAAAGTAPGVLESVEHAVVRVVNLSGAPPDSIAAEVVQVMMLKKSKTFPLTVIDGKPILSGRLPETAELLAWVRHGVEAPAVLVNRAESAVDFPTDRRIHISLGVTNIKNSVAFYRVFFDSQPVKVLNDYAKFELLEPPLNIALTQFGEPGSGGPVNHFGIQVKSSDAVVQAKERFLRANFAVEEEVATACCYAVQTKVWVGDPDGNRWEVYVTTDPNAEEGCGPDCICWQELTPNYAPESEALPVN
jgi:hypothetical protein